MTLVPLPIFAADGATSPPQAQPLRASIAKYAATAVRATPAQPTRDHQVRASQNSDPRTGGFMHSPVGIACIAVLAAGTGYALYSASHDRIHSVARQNQ